jgi:hypothetical protein
MKTSKTLVALAVAALLPLGAAVAGEGKDKSGSMGPSFDTLDTNRDGRISQAEAGVDASLVFSSADKNGDGYLDKSEWKSRDKSGTTPQPQSQSQPLPDQATPDTTEPVPGESPATEPRPDTETPRQ